MLPALRTAGRSRAWRQIQSCVRPRWSPSPLGWKAYSRISARVNSGGNAVQPPKTQVSQHGASFQSIRKASFDTESGTGFEESNFAGTVITTNPSATRIEELVQQLKSHTHGKQIDLALYTLNLTILLTPSYAQSASSSELPLNIINQLANGASLSCSLCVHTAVVDRLPVSEGEHDGAEGFAYHLAIGTRPDPGSRTLLDRSAQKPGFITFQLKNPTLRHKQASEAQLPLAQTVFSTGLPSTLLYTRYTAPASGQRLELVEREHLESCRIRLHVGQQNSHFPLIPLTPARRVEYSMGNIIRKISVLTVKDEDAGINVEFLPDRQTLTASQELETSIQDYFQSLRSQPEPVQVWALIVPSSVTNDPFDGEATWLRDLDRKEIQRIWNSGTDASNAEGSLEAAITHLLRKGARLRKVLSGGGGWGKKAGLLSLDPDVKYSTRDIRNDRGWEFSFDDLDSPEAMAKQQQQALGEVAKTGHTIMFFLASKFGNTKHLTESKPDTVDTEPSTSREHGVIFGALPSRIDEALPTSHDSVHPQPTTDARIVYQPGIFGMLSEGGMAVRAPHRHLKDDPTSAWTKLDVPFARLCLPMNGKLFDMMIGANDLRQNPGPSTLSVFGDSVRSNDSTAGEYSRTGDIVIEVLRGSMAEQAFGIKIKGHVPNDLEVPARLVRKQHGRLMRCYAKLDSATRKKFIGVEASAHYKKARHRLMMMRINSLRNMDWISMSGQKKCHAWLTLNEVFLTHLEEEFSSLLSFRKSYIGKESSTLHLGQKSDFMADDIPNSATDAQTDGPVIAESEIFRKHSVSPPVHRVKGSTRILESGMSFRRVKSADRIPPEELSFLEEHKLANDAWKSVRVEPDKSTASNFLQGNDAEAVDLVKGYLSKTK